MFVDDFASTNTFRSRDQTDTARSNQLMQSAQNRAFRMAQFAAGNQEDALMSPDIELLEFLGSFQTDAGEFVAPESVLGTEFSEFLDRATQLDSAASSDAVDDTQKGNQ